MKLANANTIGVANSSSMIVPWMVNSWLYCSGDRNCIPGRASSARISIAIRPATMKNANAVTRYMIPICFASVVNNVRARKEPRTCSRTGHGRVTTGPGCGSTLVTAHTPAAMRPRQPAHRQGLPLAAVRNISSSAP